MPGMLDTASAWLDATLADSCGETVTLHAGGDSVDVTAVVGATPIGSDLGGGVLQVWQTTDFLIEASELELAGVAFLPEVGMQIVRTLGTTEVAFVVSNATDGACFRYSDVARQMLRIHTKESP